MRSILLNPARLILFALTTALGVAVCLVPPSFAQRDPLDLAQAGFVAKDRGDFTVAIRLFDEALQRGLFADKQRGSCCTAGASLMKRSEFATARCRISTRPSRCFRISLMSTSIEGSSGARRANTSARCRIS